MIVRRIGSATAVPDGTPALHGLPGGSDAAVWASAGGAISSTTAAVRTM
jgi:hypothetical protein